MNREQDTLSSWPLGYAFLTYAIVAVALYAETGTWDVGLGWPVLGGIATLIFGFAVERRFRNAN